MKPDYSWLNDPDNEDQSAGFTNWLYTSEESDDAIIEWASWQYFMITEDSERESHRWEPDVVVGAYLCRMDTDSISDQECAGSTITMMNALQGTLVGASLAAATLAFVF